MAHEKKSKDKPGKQSEAATPASNKAEASTIPELLDLPTKTIFSIRSAVRKIIQETLARANNIERQAYFSLRDPESIPKAKAKTETLITTTLQNLLNTLDILSEQNPQIATTIALTHDKIAKILKRHKDSGAKEFPKSLRGLLGIVA